jgi:hypothetical protein
MQFLLLRLTLLHCSALHLIHHCRLQQSRLGGGEGIEGIYGSITATGMHKVLECMHHNCGLGKNSTLVDIGAGLGRCVAVSKGCRRHKVQDSANAALKGLLGALAFGDH